MKMCLFVLFITTIHLTCLLSIFIRYFLRYKSILFKKKNGNGEHFFIISWAFQKSLSHFHLYFIRFPFLLIMNVFFLISNYNAFISDISFHLFKKSAFLHFLNSFFLKKLSFLFLFLKFNFIKKFSIFFQLDIISWLFLSKRQTNKQKNKNERTNQKKKNPKKTKQNKKPRKDFCFLIDYYFWFSLCFHLNLVPVWRFIFLRSFFSFHYSPCQLRLFNPEYYFCSFW